MLIQLPEKFEYRDDGTKAYVEDGILYLTNPFYFTRVMYALTYKLKRGDVCH